MKFVYFIIVWAACAHAQLHISPVDVVKERCALNSNSSSAFPKLLGTLIGLPTCITSIKKGLWEDIVELIADHSVESACRFIKNSKIIPCTDNLITKLKPCLYQEEEKTADFILNPFVLTLDVMCSAEEKEILKNFTLALMGNTNTSCTVEEANIELIEKCAKQPMNWKKWFSDKAYVMTKEDYCSDVDISYKCVMEAIPDCLGVFKKVITMMSGPIRVACIHK